MFVGMWNTFSMDSVGPSKMERFPRFSSIQHANNVDEADVGFRRGGEDFNYFLCKFRFIAAIVIITLNYLFRGK
jgi:hypothetical protein